MKLRTDATGKPRSLKRVKHACELAVVGGGLAGVCCAITAARAGLKVVLVQDRPVLGGNASSEVRLWILGATSHMGNNNRWAREGGVVDEILVENMFRNPEGNPLILDTILLEKVVAEPNITLLLNTAVRDIKKRGPHIIKSVSAFCSQNSTEHEITARFFCDASGDGIVGFLAGAAFRMGVESRAEFGEKLAPKSETHELLGHSMYFYSKNAGRPVKFVPPSFALADIRKLPRWRDLSVGDHGCKLWWIEWGGLLDTVHDAETIKWELWKVVYGVWGHIKNSGLFTGVETLTLEWVSTIPGKRESRRFEGDYILTQQDIVEQHAHPDAVSFGGWAIDLHPPDGVFSEKPPCTQWHSKGVYQIPYRCLYSRNITNLFLAGRIISASHVAFGSTRVMGTCAHTAQAVGMAASFCCRHNLAPRELLASSHFEKMRMELLRGGQFIPGVALQHSDDLVRDADIEASSEFSLRTLRPDGTKQQLARSWAMLIPLPPGPVPKMELILDVANPTELCAELRVSSRPDNHTPDITLMTLDLPLAAGSGQRVRLDFDTTIETPRYAFVCLMKNEAVAVALSEQRITGVLAVCNNGNKAVAKSSKQMPHPDSGIETFEFWTPLRRPNGKNFALKLDPPVKLFGVANLKNGFDRHTCQPNAWVPAIQDTTPTLEITWPSSQRINRIELAFDTDFDHPMESVLMEHPERVMPFCIQQLEILDGKGQSLFRCEDNHQTRLVVTLATPAITKQLTIIFANATPHVPTALFAVRCYE